MLSSVEIKVDLGGSEERSLYGQVVIEAINAWFLEMTKKITES